MRVCISSYLSNGQIATDHCYNCGYILFRLIVFWGGYIRGIFSVLIVSVGCCYAQQEMLMKGNTVEVADI